MIMRPDAGSLFQRLYGGNDGILPGNPCETQQDRCRGSSALYVCLDDARDTVGAGLSCKACESDAECRFEYAYLDDLTTCGGDGLCQLPSGTGCASGSLECRTARAGDFTCVEGACETCISHEECVDEYGEEWQCRFSAGQCVFEPAAGP